MPILTADEKKFILFLEQKANEAIAVLEASKEFGIADYAQRQFNDALVVCAQEHGLQPSRVRWNTELKDLEEVPRPKVASMPTAKVEKMSAAELEPEEAVDEREA